jgi:hypothetical protein
VREAKAREEVEREVNRRVTQPREPNSAWYAPLILGAKVGLVLGLIRVAAEMCGGRK